MYAFTPSLPLSIRGNTKSSLCQPRTKPVRTPTWRACQELPPAQEASRDLREQLRQLSEDRRLRAERTQAAIEEMSEQLSKITAKIRADAGMPPVADPPAPTKNKAPAKVPLSPPLDDDGSGNSDEPYMDPSNFGYESTAGWQVLAAADELPENEGTVEFRMKCDMHGCSIIEVKGDAPPGPGVRQKFIQAGPSFRVGYDPEAPKSFCGMVGSDQWLLALSYDEIRHFKRLCLSLEKKMGRIGRGEEEPPVKKPVLRRSGDGMFNMRVAKAGLDCSVELESKFVWVQAIGQPIAGQYCIRAIFMEGRQSEGFWAMDAVPGFLAALHKLGVE